MKNEIVHHYITVLKKKIITPHQKIETSHR